MLVKAESNKNYISRVNWNHDTCKAKLFRDCNGIVTTLSVMSKLLSKRTLKAKEIKHEHNTYYASRY